MPIAALPDSTTRAIGSSLVLNDACSAVKELVDNALDASATSIVIEISLDTLDIIQVKDNGSGVGVEDRQLVCKRGCTSKIRTIQDLERLGGSSLGFRGEALASVAELSESLIVTTRVEGEVVGTAMKFGQNAQLQSSSSASHPVGTTFRVQGFLQAIPVRRQTAKKNAQKTLSAIKKLLQDYAFARPATRFSLRVLKSKNDKANWSYAPSSGSTNLLEVATKILGQDIAAQCELRSDTQVLYSNQGGSNESYAITAILGKPDSVPAKLHNIGHFVAIDGRPVTTARGTIKEVVKKYRKFYSAATSPGKDHATKIEPFLCMQISCPAASYDVNVEPAKDEVLFSDASNVTRLAEQLFVGFYGGQDLDRPSLKKRLGASGPSAVIYRGFDTLLAHKPPHSDAETTPTDRNHEAAAQAPLMCPNTHEEHEDDGRSGSLIIENAQCQPTAAEVNDQPLQKATNIPRPHHNMYDLDEELFEEDPATSQNVTMEEPEETGLRSVKATNPWSLAKFNAPAQPRRSAIRPQAPVQLMTPGSGESLSTRTGHIDHAAPRLDPAGLPSPTASSPSPERYQNPGPPLRPWRPGGDALADDDIEFTQEIRPQSSMSRQNGALDAWVRPQKPSVHPPFRRASYVYNKDARFSDPPLRDFDQRYGSSREGPSSPTSEADKASERSSARSSSASRPFRSPLLESPAHSPITETRSESPRSAAAEMASELGPAPFTFSKAPPPRPMLSPAQHVSRHQMPPPPSPSQRTFKASQSPNPELDDILEFEERKRQTMMKHRKAQAKIPFGETNPAKLAQIQRSSASSLSAPSPMSGKRRNSPQLDLREEPSNPAEDFEKRFGTRQDEQVELSLPRNTPHHNRYLAAKQRLTYGHPEPAEDINEDTSPAGSLEAGAALVDGSSYQMPESDPRAYLIRHKDSIAPLGAVSGLTKTGLKIHRTKTARLPLETTPLDAATHNLRAAFPHPFPTLAVLEIWCRNLGVSDHYAKNGSDDFVRWSVNGRDVPGWEQSLRELVALHFRAKVGAECVEPDVTLSLVTAINAHVDVHDL